MRRVFVIKFAVAALAGAVLTGCGTQSTPPLLTSPSATAALDDSAAQARGGGNQSATGNAHITLADGVTPERFAFNAVKRANGNVTGQFQLHSDQEGGLKLHGMSTCLTIVGRNLARIGGEITHTSDPTLPPGTPVIFTVVDNGEGRKSPPDQTSDFFVVTTTERDAHCTVGFNLPLIPSERGNIQVHP